MAWAQEPVQAEPEATELAGSFYRAEIDSSQLDAQGELIDQIIGYALDTLDAQSIALRVYEAAPATM
ncbi:hypothetical protein SE17_43940 [Kouleothrix aurantiaca]|uniref:Uncharacterized protein n=1 Tax=Kouleothrix aurantiaca TaxID=186479 RepID=A0A0P9D100_9CHLR|nr:hypothetical protein SE17_43940 [Kouleothrix aurantiaca]